MRTRRNRQNLTFKYEKLQETHVSKYKTDGNSRLTIDIPKETHIQE